MKRHFLRFISTALIIVSFLTVLTSCEARVIGFGSQKITDPAEYGNFGVIDAPFFFPESTEGYIVNSYSYTLELYLDICYEIFLDLTVSEEEMTKLTSAARSKAGYKYESKPYYDNGYTEIVFNDIYSEGPVDDTTGEGSVGYAIIEKIIYNKENGNIIYVQFIAYDYSVYALSDVAYFNRFKINDIEYISHLNDNRYGV